MSQNSRKSGTGSNRSKNNKKYSKKGRSNSPKNTVIAENLPAEGRSNDPNWYFTNSLLAEQVGQISFQDFIGNGPFVGEEETTSTPAIIAIKVNPAPGLTYNVNEQEASITTDVKPSGFIGDKTASGINIAGFKIYNFLASNSGRVSNYAPQDITAMILGIGALAETSEVIRRVFGVSMLTNPRNRSLPRLIVEMMGIDYDDFIKNAANYRMRFNTEISRINQIPLIGNVAFIAKCRDMFQHVYVDSASSMSTMFFYIPETTWVLDEDTYEGGTILKTTELWPLGHDHSYTTMGDLITIMSQQITALLNSTTLNLVYADLLNASSRSNFGFWSFDYLAENYSVIPEYNRNALLQLHNMFILGAPTYPEFKEFSHGSVSSYYVTPNNDVYPDPEYNALVYNPGFIVPALPAHGPSGHDDFLAVDQLREVLLDFDVETPDLVDKIEATRFAVSFSGYRAPKTGDADKFYSTFVNMPDHYVVRLEVSSNERNGNGEPNPVRISSSYIAKWFDGTAGEEDYYTPILLQKMSAVDMAPYMYIFTPIISGGSIYGSPTFASPTAVIGERNFYTKATAEWLRRVNRLMYTGLFEFRF